MLLLGSRGRSHGRVHSSEMCHCVFSLSCCKFVVNASSSVDELARSVLSDHLAEISVESSHVVYESIA